MGFFKQVLAEGKTKFIQREANFAEPKSAFILS